MNDIIVIGLMVAVVLILIRVIVGSPLIKRVRETFASGSASGSSKLINSSTECPAGSQLYMYEGRVFCCSGTINTDASLQAAPAVSRQTRVAVPPPSRSVFTMAPLNEALLKTSA